MAAKKGRGRRYTPAEKKKILAAAKKEGLSGAQVQRRFGVSPLTFYRWRGPVRSRRGRTKGGTGLRQVETLVAAQVQKVLPRVIREQVNAYLKGILTKPTRRRRRGRPRLRRRG